MRQCFAVTCLPGRIQAISYLRRMLRRVLNRELSSPGLSDAGAVGGVEVEFMDKVELAIDGAGDAR